MSSSNVFEGCRSFGKIVFLSFNPTKENSKVPFITGNCIENHPLLLVAVPIFVFANLMVTPGSGSFCLS